MIWLQSRLNRITTNSSTVELTQRMIVVGVLLLAVLMGIAAAYPRIGPLVVVAGAGLAVGCAILLRYAQFEHAILLILVVAQFGNSYVFIIPGSSARIVMSMFVATGVLTLWGVRLLVNRRLRPDFILPLTRPIVVFCGVNLLAYFWSTLMWDPLVPTTTSFQFMRVAALYLNMLLPLITLMIGYNMGHERWLRLMTTLFLVGGCVALMAVVSNVPVFVDAINNGSHGLFTTWFCAIALGQILFNNHLSNWFKLSLLLATVGWLLFRVVEGAGWLSGWVPALIAVGMIIFLYSKRSATLIMFGGILVAVALFAQIYAIVIEPNVAEGSLGRLVLWANSIRHWLLHPLFGTGPAAYAVYNRFYTPSGVTATHSNYFDILVQTGLVGTIVFAWFLTAVYRLARTLIRSANVQRSGFLNGLVNGIAAGCAGAAFGMLLGDWVIPFAYNQGTYGFDNAVLTWIMLGMLLSVYRIVVLQDGQKESGDQKAVSTLWSEKLS